MNISALLDNVPKNVVLLLGEKQMVAIRQLYGKWINPFAETFILNGRQIVPVKIKTYCAYVGNSNYIVVEQGS